MNNLARSSTFAPQDCQVLVVGAGPTGLVLAAELLARGIATRVLDKGDGVVLQSRAGCIHARAMEVFDMLGISERFLERAQVVRGFRFYSDGGSLLDLDLTGNGSRFGCMLFVPQHVTETLLRARIAELGGVIEQGVELLGFQQDQAGVTAMVRDGSGTERTITAGHLVGCDGAHSRVRHELGLDFEGHSYPQDVWLADVRLDWSRSADQVHFFCRSNGRPLICFPMPGHMWRLAMPYAGEGDRRTPSLEEVQQLVDERTPERVTVSDPAWLSTFRTHRRSASRYRRGRVLLAGDAVHIHSPAGGQGMNTGITDAHNLAWKLALVAAGISDEWLLDTYEEERQPVAAQVLALTHTITRLSALTHPIERALRDTLLAAAGRLPGVSRLAASRLGQVNVAYPRTRLTGGRSGPGHSRPGDRAADVPVVARGGETRLYEVLRGRLHVLIVAGSDAGGLSESASLRPYRDVLEIVLGVPDGRVRTLRPIAGGVCLVRPDGYVAAVGRLDRMGPVLDYLRQLYGTGD
jgi:2-polyprenyl-6-methoxyphenol hydroxylase-like FAD-dependent oxidoreductase